MTDCIPTAVQALRHFAAELDAQASRYDQPRFGKERSTTAEALRHAASLARQRAARLENLISTARQAKELG